MSLMYMNSHTILKDQLYAWTKSLTSYWAMQGNHCPCVRVTIRKQIRNMSGMVPAARRIIKRLEIHYTPKHGSWLNLVESFFSKMTKQMLRGIRVNSKQELEDRIYLYFEEVNREPIVYHWTYKMDDISQEEANKAGVKSNIDMTI